MFVTGGGPLKPQYDSSGLFGWVSSLSCTSHAQTVLHLEDPSDFARADFGDLAVRWDIDDSEQHRSAVFHDDARFRSASVERSDWTICVNAGLLDDGVDPVDRYQGIGFSGELSERRKNG